MAKDLKKEALEYHRYPRPGKIEVIPTKPYDTPDDLALAYSPGVAIHVLRLPMILKKSTAIPTVAILWP